MLSRRISQRNRHLDKELSLWARQRLAFFVLTLLAAVSRKGFECLQT